MQRISLPKAAEKCLEAGIPLVQIENKPEPKKGK